MPVGMSHHPLPEPVLDPEKRSKVKVDENHGLWGFFSKERNLLTQPLQEAKFGESCQFMGDRDGELSLRVKAVRGLRENYETNPGKTSMRSGGFVARSEIGWRLRKPKGSD